MQLPIYLDYVASTPVDPRVTEKMLEILQLDKRKFANPTSRSHRLGWEAQEVIEQARMQLAELIHAKPEEIIWTSGATESDNLAIKGSVYFNQHRGKHIVTSAIEHSAVLDTCHALEQEGFEVTYLKPQSTGLFNLEQIAEAIRSDTVLVSIMHANNEIGVIQDIKAIGEYCRERSILFHVDAAQSLGKISIDLSTMPVDMMAFSGHKIYGPKGIGALYVRRDPRVMIKPLLHGGGQEQGLRSGTLATHQIVAMGEACRILKSEMNEENVRITQLRDRLWRSISDTDALYLNGDWEQRVPGNLNISVAYLDGEELVLALKDIALSTGSACNHNAFSGSHVLAGIGRDRALAQSALRLSLGRFTTMEEIDFAAHCIQEQIQRLREHSSAWRQREAEKSV